MVFGSMFRALSATGEDAPQSSSTILPARLDHEAGVEPAAGAERVAAADDGQPHRQAFALGRAETSSCQRLRLVRSSGTASLAGFMKSTAIIPVMSATL